MKEIYSLGLLAFHMFCNFKSIPEVERAPVRADILSTFITHLAGSYTPSMVVNYVSTVQAWHAVHRLEWKINKKEADLLYKVACHLAPPTSKHPPREPYTLETIRAIKEHLDLTMPLHVVVFTCLTTTFFAVACTREFTVPNLKAFDLARHITQAGISTQHDQDGLLVTCFRLPWSKKSPIGEEVNWARQDSPHDPESTLNNHFHVNNLTNSVPLFTYQS